MPSGYTSSVQSGKITDFKSFAISCARMMGACIMMRDDSFDTPIPEQFKPSKYHEDRIDELKVKLTKLGGMTEAEALQEHLKEYDQGEVDDAEYRNRQALGRKRYENMLAKVKNWTPPTPDHNDFKRIMIEQLTDSIKWDCGGNYSYLKPLITGKEWLNEQIASLKEDILYHEEENLAEIERTSSRNLWIKQLRESIKGF